MKTSACKILTFFLIFLNLKIANTATCIATVSGLYPTEIRTIELNSSLDKLQSNTKVDVQPTLPNEKVNFYVRPPNTDNRILVEGSLVGVTTLENGKAALVISTKNSNSGVVPVEKTISVERIVPNSIVVSPIFSKAQAQESAVRILEAYERGEQVTFKEVVSGRFVDSTQVGRIDGVVMGEDGFVERFYIATSIGSLMTKSPKGIVPGSIKVMEISPRKLSAIENSLFKKLQTARQNKQVVSVKMKTEHQSYSWGPGRANSSSGFIENINLVGDGEWVISIITASQRVINFRLQEIEPGSLQVSQSMGLSGSSNTLRLSN